MKNALAFATVASCVAALCHAAGPPVPENLLACSKMQDAAERVRCYDAQIAAMSTATGTTPAPPSTAAPAPAAPTLAPTAASAATRAPAAPAAVQSAHAAPAAPPAVMAPDDSAALPRAPAVTASDPSRAAEFGQEQLPQAGRSVKKDQSLSSRITALNAVGANKYVISLENGQIWRQSESDQVAAFFRIGDEVRIERGTLGSYHLWAPSTGQKNWILVMRMR
jgi:hypothetical protein